MFPELFAIYTKRKKLGITQKELSKKAGISQSLLTKIERGVVIPNYKIACNLFEILDEYEYRKEKVLSQIMRKNVILLNSSDTVSKMIRLAKKYSISQFPVLEQNRVVGSITTNNSIGIEKEAKLKTIMQDPFPMLTENTPISVANNILKQFPAIIIINGKTIVGIVTAEDLL
ncbi:MAG: CBS domain-containing protein [Candidatus Micrarchaeaceae archaeon]